ncbi:MAG: eCIS core domain-containing protein, partial [Acidimicrobiia bacterium]
MTAEAMRALTPDERSHHAHVPEADRARARIAVVPVLNPGAGGMTIGRFILIRRGREHDPQLLAHELVHVRQWREQGRLRFLWRYFSAYFGGRRRGLKHRDAYRAIPFEVEAR